MSTEQKEAVVTVTPIDSLAQEGEGAGTKGSPVTITPSIEEKNSSDSHLHEHISVPQVPPPAPGVASQADILAQIQALLGQLQTQTGKPLVIPSLNVTMDCQQAMTDEEDQEMEVEFEVKIRYKSKNGGKVHTQCQATRENFNASGVCLLQGRK